MQFWVYNKANNCKFWVLGGWDKTDANAIVFQNRKYFKQEFGVDEWYLVPVKEEEKDNKELFDLEKIEREYKKQIGD